MDVVIIAPAVGNEDKLSEMIRCLNSKVMPQFSALGGVLKEVRPGGIYPYVQTNGVLQGQPKGKGIIECLKGLSPSTNYVICCDCSGKIPYEFIVDVFQQLISDYKTCCVMASRKGYKAISEERFLLEQFEIFCLLKYFNKDAKDIPDAQCGLWGFRYGKIDTNGTEKEITLTGEGYEIELDLLGEVVEKGLSHSFIDIQLPQPEQEGTLPHTQYDYKQNFIKMQFLINKYSELKNHIPLFILEFEKRDDIIKKFVEIKGLKLFWEKYKLELVESKIISTD